MSRTRLQVRREVRPLRAALGFTLLAIGVVLLINSHEVFAGSGLFPVGHRYLSPMRFDRWIPYAPYVWLSSVQITKIIGVVLAIPGSVLAIRSTKCKTYVDRDNVHRVKVVE